MHLAWFMVSKSVAHALSYDARLVPSTALGEVAEPVSRCAEDLAHYLLHGGALGEAATEQIRLPGAFGGMGLRAEAHGLMADASLWAAWATMHKRVPQLAAVIGVRTPECTGKEDALAAKRRLQTAGVVVDDLGGVKFTEAARDVYTEGPWHKDVKADDLGALCLQPEAAVQSVAQGVLPARVPRRFASRIFRHLEALAATRLWQSSDKDRQIGLLSAGGPGAGTVWLQTPIRGSDYSMNSHFRAASLRRIGALAAPRGATCHIPAATAQEGGFPEPCGHLLDSKMLHPMVCKQGPARMRPHRALAAALAKQLRRCGAEVDLERTVVELAKVDRQGVTQEAILDLVVTFPGSVQPLLIDVTIRCPHATRYQHASHTPGEAASTAAREKHDRYGEDVLPVAMESYGRISNDAHRSLECLAAHAGPQLKDPWLAPRLLPTWRSALERVVQFTIADIDLLALGMGATAAESRISRGRISRGS